MPSRFQPISSLYHDPVSFKISPRPPVDHTISLLSDNRRRTEATRHIASSVPSSAEGISDRVVYLRSSRRGILPKRFWTLRQYYNFRLTLELWLLSRVGLLWLEFAWPFTLEPVFFFLWLTMPSGANKIYPMGDGDLHCGIWILKGMMPPFPD